MSTAIERPLQCLASATNMADFRELDGNLSESDVTRSDDNQNESDPVRPNTGTKKSDKLLPGSRRGRRGKRRAGDMRRNLLSGDHGTFLALESEDVAQIPTVDNVTTVALAVCRSKVLTPYLKFLLSVGWVPVFPSPSNAWQKAINIIHPLIVVALVLLGYVIQYAGCFARYITVTGTVTGMVPDVVPAENASNTTASPPQIGPCESYAISQFLIPDLLHSLAYAYSFYTLRISESEQLPTLMERVFLQTSKTATGVRSQGRLIHKLRWLLFSGIAWVFLSEAAQVMHIVSQYETLNFYWMEPESEFGRAALIVLMLISFVFLDVVYVAVVINYSVQCVLLIFYVQTLSEKVLEKQFDFPRAIKEMNEIADHMRVLNQNPGLAVSIVLVNFATMALLGSLSILTPNDVNSLNALMVASTMISVVLWAAVIATPVVIAAVLTSKCAWLRKLGHKTRIRPFGFEDTPLQELDSFLVYTATLTLSAKIFLIPVRGAYVAAVVLIVCSTMLLLFQVGAIHVWL